MNVGIVIVSCFLVASVTGNENEWKELDFDLEISFETEDLNGPVDTLSVVTTTTTITESDALRLLAAKSEPIPKTIPKLVSKLTPGIQSKNATLDNKRSKKPYSFEYAVEDSKSGLDYGHKESSDGEVVTGTYYVLLPDGRKERVNYKADVNGYVADVSYEGEAKKDNAQQSQKAISSAISTQLQAYSNSPSIASTSTQSPQISSSIFSVTTKGASLSSLHPASPASVALNKSADKAEIIVSTESVFVSASSPNVSSTAPTTPSLIASSTTNLLRSSTIFLTTPTTPTSTNTPTSLSAPIVTSASTLSPTSISTSAPYSPTLNSTTLNTSTSTNTPTPISAYLVTSITTLSSTSTTPSSTIQKSTLNSTISLTTPTTPTSTNTPTSLSASISTSTLATTPTTPTSTKTSTSISDSIVTSVTIPSSNASTPSSIPKPTLNSTLSQVSVTASPLPSKSNQNSTSAFQFSLANKDQITSTPAMQSPESSAILKIVSQTPGTSFSENESFFQALAGFIRSSGPIFVYCRSTLPTCSDSTGSPSPLVSPCSNCKSLQKICSKLEFTGQTYPINGDKLEAFQAEIPAAPVWPAIKSSPAEEVVLKFGSASSDVQRNLGITVATSSVPKNVSFEVPEGLADVVQSADTHFSYCQKIRPFCSRLESTRPYWEGSPETPSKQKEFLLSTIQACSYCRSLWPICSELESTGFLLDPSQLFTIHSLEEDVRSAVFTISYCRNVTQDCSEFLKSNRFSTKSPIPNKSFQAINGTYPVLLSTTSSPLVSADKPTSGSSLPPQLPNSTISESDGKSEDGDGVLEEPKFLNYCIRMTPICSQLLSI